MYQLRCHIEIKNQREGRAEVINIQYVSQLDSSSSWDSLTDTCTITLPKKITWEGKRPLVRDTSRENTDEKPIFERGDEVTVKLGYDREEHMHIAFQGYITDIIPDSPLVLKCQDRMWYLYKKIHINMADFNAAMKDKAYTLKNYVEVFNQLVFQRFNRLNETLKKQKLNPIKATGEEALISEGVHAEQFKLGKLSFLGRSNRSNHAALFLTTLKERFGIYSWYEGDTLRIDVGDRYQGTFAKKYIFNFQKNIINHQLTFINETDEPLHVLLTNTLPIDKAKDAKAGSYPNGLTATTQNLELAGTIHRQYGYKALQSSELENIAKQIYTTQRYTGFKGSFTTFGQYPVKHGDIAILEDGRHPERNGSFLIKSVRSTFGTQGYRQDIELERVVTLN